MINDGLQPLPARHSRLWRVECHVGSQSRRDPQAPRAVHTSPTDPRRLRGAHFQVSGEHSALEAGDPHTSCASDPAGGLSPPPPTHTIVQTHHIQHNTNDTPHIHKLHICHTHAHSKPHTHIHTVHIHRTHTAHRQHTTTHIHIPVRFCRTVIVPHLRLGVSMCSLANQGAVIGPGLACDQAEHSGLS